MTDKWSRAESDELPNSGLPLSADAGDDRPMMPLLVQAAMLTARQWERSDA
nr:hypothetical protein [Streptomyces niger]